MKLLYAALFLALIGCNAPAGPDAADPLAAPKRALQGEWAESEPDSSGSGFAWTTLTLVFAGDSLAILERKRTDDVGCALDGENKTCSDARWTNHYQGRYTLVGDAMEMAIEFRSTTANSMTAIEGMGDRRLRMRYALNGAVPTVLTLEEIDREIPLAGKKSIILHRK